MADYTITMIIGVTLAGFVGVAFGALWGLSRHEWLYCRVTAYLLQRMRETMESLNIDEWKIDKAQEYMGSTIIPPRVPMPAAPATGGKLSNMDSIGKVWNEEDERMLIWLCRIVHSQRVGKVITLREESELGEWMDKWLNHNPQPKQEWSEEDKRILSTLTKYLENKGGGIDGWECSFLANWLKSLKDRYAWKPSKEQMEAIKDAIEFLGCTKKVREDLKSLYEQLKKLREE